MTDVSSPKNTHILNGNAEDLHKECEDYESDIKSVGGIDLFLGGIGAGKSQFSWHTCSRIRLIS